MIAWKEEYRIGVEAIDEQHKKLFEIANRAYDLLKNELLLDKYDQIVAIFDELKDYTEYHFSCEQKYMASIGYKKMLSHKVVHDDFIDKIKGIDLEKVDDDQDQYLMDLLNFVVQWIEQHILGMDKKIIDE